MYTACWFPKAAVTNGHTLGGCDGNVCPMVLGSEVRGPSGGFEAETFLPFCGS